MQDQELISYNEALIQVLADLDGPISVDEFIDRFLAIRPATNKDPRRVVQNRLHDYFWRVRILSLDKKTLIPTPAAMRGIRFAIPVDRAEAKRGILFIYPAFEIFLRREIAPQDVKLYDTRGHPLPVQIVTVKHRVESLYGVSEVEHKTFDLHDWYDRNEVRRDDCILVTVEDWEQGRFRLEHESAKGRQRRQPEIEAKNKELADILFDLLESSSYERINIYEAIPTAFARMQDPRGYPGDHWQIVVEQDPRMLWCGDDIHYSEWHSLFEEILHREHASSTPKPPAPLSPADERRIYRFKVALKYRKGLWRCIEIQGGQTLRDFDWILRDAFNHDTSDHLSGFWKRVRRGSSRRFREIDLGDIDPFGGGEGANVCVAALEMRPGDRLKYVYDFGDWIEHVVTLEDVVEPEPDVRYPRIVAQNRPRHRYCERCEAEGRKTVATWICIECSRSEARNVLVCEDCLERYHEDHYADEILY